MYSPLTFPRRRLGFNVNTPYVQLPVAPQFSGTKYSGLPSRLRSYAKARSAKCSVGPSCSPFNAVSINRLNDAFGRIEGEAQFQSTSPAICLLLRANIFAHQPASINQSREALRRASVFRFAASQIDAPINSQPAHTAVRKNIEPQMRNGAGV